MIRTRFGLSFSEIFADVQMMQQKKRSTFKNEFANLKIRIRKTISECETSIRKVEFENDHYELYGKSNLKIRT